MSSILRSGRLLFVLCLGLVPVVGCGGEEGTSEVTVGGAVNDPEIEAVNQGSSEIPVNEVPGN